MSKRHPMVSVGLLCAVFDKSRQAWYKAIKENEQTALENRLLLNEIDDIREKLPRCGVEKLHYLLTQKHFYEQWGLKIGRDKLADILRENGLLIVKNGRKIFTTYSKHRFYKYPNIVKGLVLTAPNQVWVSDITYVLTWNGFVYLSMITDAYSRKIVGWAVHKTLATEGCLKALQKALDTLPHTTKGLIHHSDRGVQYCSNAYIQMLVKRKIGISMTHNGDPYENALAERMNRTIKEEMLDNQSFRSIHDAQAKIEKAINNYNQIRPHWSLKFKTPNEVHKNEQKKVLKNCQPISG
jgi:putative transposase